MGDVPVGVFLSGGLDSSLVAAIAAKVLAERGERLQTFAVGTESSPDLAAARLVAAHIGSEHRETTYTAADALAVMPVAVRAIESFDPALVRSAVPNYMLSAFTAQHVKVVLTGEGADELFAGYEYLRDFTDPETLHRELVRTVESLHNLNLQRCDRVTMAHGLEARVPFLDREVIEWALRLPPGFKLAGPGQPEKRLLREAFDGWLPHELLWRDKAEFGDGSGAKDVLTRRDRGRDLRGGVRARARPRHAAAAHARGARLLPHLPRAPRRRAARAHAQPLRHRVARIMPSATRLWPLCRGSVRYCFSSTNRTRSAMVNSSRMRRGSSGVHFGCWLR